MFCIPVVPFLQFRDTAAFYPPRRSEYLRKRTQFFGRQFARFPQNFDKLGGGATVHKFLHQNPKLRLNLQSQKTISFIIAIMISLNIHIDKILFPSNLETTILTSFSSKSLNYTSINLFLQKLSTLTIAKFTKFTSTDNKLQTSVKYLRAITVCSAFTFNCGYDNSTIHLIGTCIVRLQSVWVNLACTKRFFNLPAEVIIKVRNAHRCARCAMFLLRSKQVPFS